MGFVDRARSASLRLRATARLLPHLPEIRRGGHSSPAKLLVRNAEEHSTRTAILYLNERHTWAEVNAASNRWARFFLSRGVARGDVVALVMDNRPEYLGALMGATKIRAITACINTNLTGTALAHAIRIGQPRLVIAGSEHEAAVDEALCSVPNGMAPRVEVQREHGAGTRRVPLDGALSELEADEIPGLSPRTDEPTTYLYTSGTTGLPKAAVVTNQRFLAAAYGFGKILHEATPEDVIYAALPLYHGTAQWGGWGACLATGAGLALRRKFSASAFWSDVVAFDATRILYIGELCRYLVHQPPSPDEHKHRVRIAVGNGLRPDVWSIFQERSGIPLIREFYGATEGNAPLANLEGRPGMIGKLGMGQAVVRCDLSTGAPLRDARGRCSEVSPGETGLLVARISRLATFDGYVDERATRSKVLADVLRNGDAWFDTGDLVTLHEDSWVSFADRVGDTFRWKGENVSTNEVAGLLNQAPGVLESNVYGVIVPGADGRAGMASLRVTQGFDVDAFARDVQHRLPRYARPLFLRLQDDMRVTATLKHQKVDYRSEGYDPGRTSDRLFVSIDGEYVPVTADVHRSLQAGRLVPD